MSTVENGDELQAHVGEADEVKVVVPVVRECWTGSLMTRRPLDMRSGSLSALRISFLARRSRRLPEKLTSVWRFVMLLPRFPPTRSSLPCGPGKSRGWSSQLRLTVLRNEKWKACRSDSS